MSDFLLGVNYWPRRSAMAMWQRFDRGEIDEDFARIAELNLRVVRFFLMWEAFQPEPGRIDPAMLEKLEWLISRLEAHGLLGMPALYTGHMSGVNWLPGWALDPQRSHGRFRTLTFAGDSPHGIGDFYTGALLEAQRTFARAVGSALADSATVHAWDLGNEFSNLREPNSPRDAAEWGRVLSADLHKASGRPVTGGTHGEDLQYDRNLRFSTLCADWEYATMHGYTVYSDFSRDRLDPEVVPFLAELAASCAGKRVLFSEFGNPTCPADSGARTNGSANGSAFACLSEDEMAEYATAVLERLAARGALGAFWWCWADYARDLAHEPPFDRAPHELTFGIIRSDGSEKPVARALARFGERAREVTAQPAPIVNESAYYTELPASQHKAYAAYVVDAALAPLAARMEKLGLRKAFVAELIENESTFETGNVALRWAGMPNKNERKLTHEVFEALAHAGFVAPVNESHWRVVRR